MKVAVVGLGAVGGLIAHRLARAGVDVSGLARGDVLQAVHASGLALCTNGETQTVRIEASDDAAHLGPHDLVIVALKAPALREAAPNLAPLIGSETIVLPAMNGVPWWFLESAPDGVVSEPNSTSAPASAAGLRDDTTSINTTSQSTRPVTTERFLAPLATVDPDRRIAAALPLEKVLGCVVHLSCASPSPGVVERGFGNRIIVGKPRGGASPRADAVCALLRRAGFDAELSRDIRSDIWYKLWGNMTTNPISALTGATTDRILDDPLVQGFMLRAMAEAAAIGERIGCPIAQSGEDRIAVTRQLGAFRTSMLQDAVAMRPLEVDALIGAVHEIGLRVGVPTPNVDALFGLTRLMAETRALACRDKQ